MLRPTQPTGTPRSSHLAQQKLEAAARAIELCTRLTESASAISALSTEGWLDTSLLGSALPGGAVADGADSKPFALPVRIEVAGLTAALAVEQGMAVVREVQASFDRGPVIVSAKQGGNAGASCVMWENLGSHSIRLDPAKSNRINWLDKSWAARHLALGPASTWSAQRAMLLEVLPHAEAWVRVLEGAYEDGGMDVKDDCRLDSSSARCHQDGGNCMQPGKPPPLVRLAINVSSCASGRSLDYLNMASDGRHLFLGIHVHVATASAHAVAARGTCGCRLVDGDERAALLLHSVSQDGMWHALWKVRPDVAPTSAAQAICGGLAEADRGLGRPEASSGAGAACV